MKQKQPAIKQDSLAVQNLPPEIVHLLNVFARIEARRQEKLRASRKEVA